MVQCIDCIFWGDYGYCQKIEHDGVKPPEDGARIKVNVLDDSGLTVDLQTGAKFSCGLGRVKPSRKIKHPKTIPLDWVI